MYGATRDESESLYQLLSDDTFRYIKENSSATSSDIWYVVQEAKETRMNERNFIKQMYNIADTIPDKDMTNNIRALYFKEIKRID